MLSARLVELKNGDQAAQARYRDIQGLFTELAPGHRFELHSWQRQKIDGPAEQEIEIEVFPTSGSTAESAPIPHPLRFAGTGVEQALVIAETLVGAPERILILDEPATNLHPAWQSVVRSHLRSRERTVPAGDALALPDPIRERRAVGHDRPLRCEAGRDPNLPAQPRGPV